MIQILITSLPKKYGIKSARFQLMPRFAMNKHQKLNNPISSPIDIINLIYNKPKIIAYVNVYLLYQTIYNAFSMKIEQNMKMF